MGKASKKSEVPVGSALEPQFNSLTKPSKKNQKAEPTLESRFNGLMTLGGREIQVRTAPEHVIRGIAQEHSLDDGVAQTLAKRGFNKENVDPFLNLSLARQLPDPSSFLDMDKAIARTIKAIMNDEQIAIFGDYDADGATYTAQMVRYLRAIGHTGRMYIPDRFTEGYGPNPAAMLKLREEGATLCLMGDCGTAAVDKVLEDGTVVPSPIKVAQDSGMDVLIFDHHSPEAALPPAYAIVNPKRLDERSPHTMLAACGVGFMFLVGLNRALRENGFFRGKDEENSNKPQEPDLRKLLAITALGTVADVVPLVGVNRLLVHYGLSELNKYEIPGIAALCEVCGFSREDMERKGRKIEAQDIAFFLGPRLNAAGRIDRARTSAELLSTDNITQAQDHALATDSINKARQGIEREIVQQAMPAAEAQVEAGSPIIIVAHKDWNPGVIGIAASRLKEKFDRPAIVIGCHEGSWKGSGRSIPGIDIGAAVMAAKQKHILLAGGGHPMACGLGVEEGRIEEFREFMAEQLAPKLAALPKHATYHIDAVLNPASVTETLIRQQARLAPFGQGNPEPLYLLNEVQVKFAAVAGETGDHVRCTFTKNGTDIGGIAFRSANEPHGQALLDSISSGRSLHVIGTADLNTFNGRTKPQFKVIDVALA